MKKPPLQELKGRKVSDIFREYAEPYLVEYLASHGEATLDELEFVLKLPWMVWNAMVLKEDPDCKLDYWASIQLYIRRMPPEVKDLVDGMRERKQTYFGEYKILLGDFKLVQEKSGVKLVVEWREKKIFSPSMGRGK